MARQRDQRVHGGLRERVKFVVLGALIFLAVAGLAASADSGGCRGNYCTSSPTESPGEVQNVKRAECGSATRAESVREQVVSAPAVAPFGSVSIGTPQLETTEVDGAFDVLYRFTLSLRVAGYDTDAVATLIFDNGLERARPQGVGEHAVMLSALDAGFHELVRVVVNSSWVERGTDAWQCYLFFRGTREGLCAGTFLQCVQAQQTFRASVGVEQWAPAGPADESECVGILAYEYDKVNLFEHTLLAPALDPSSALFAHETRQEGGKAYQQRPVPFELANSYAVSHSGEVLSDPIVIFNATVMAFVSPLVPSATQASEITASVWTCQFLSQHRNSRPDASGVGQAFEVLSSSTTAVVETDDMHTFRVLCPIPADMAACLGASLCAGQGGPRRVFGGFFRDGKPVGGHGLIDQVDADSGGADQVHMLGLSELAFTGGGANPAGRDERQGRLMPVEICTMVRDEADDIEEFVAYHLLFGASRVHVYLHLSQDATAHRLEEYVRRGQVTLRAWDFDWSPMFMRFQSHALNDCLLRSLGNAEPTWLIMMDIDEFLVPTAALARTGLSREELFAPSLDGENLAELEGRLASLLPMSLGMLHEGLVEGEVGGRSAYKVGWLPFSSQVSQGGDGGGLTMDLHVLHGHQLLPPPGRFIGDRQNGKIIARGSVHTDFSGHSATIAADGVGQVPPAELLIAHYLGRARSYVSSVKQHQDVVNLRRRQVEEAPTTTWRDSPLCFFRILFRRHLCSAPTQSHLAESACAARPDASWLQQLQDCLIEGAEPSPYPFQLPMSRQTGKANDR